MNLRILLLTLSIFAITILSAQSNDPVIMVINGNPVLKSEFEYSYNKNNATNTTNKRTLEEYVDLFINFKLKVEEAKAQGLDTTKTFINELKNYRTLFAKSYSVDDDTQLEKEHEEFRLLIQDLYNGSLLFEISNKEVWERASRDVKGVEQFFKKNKNAYKWNKPHYKGHVILCKDKETLKAAKAIAGKANRDSLDSYLPKRLNNDIQYVKVQKGIFAQGDNNVVDKQIFKVKNVELSDEYPYTFLIGKKLNYMPESYLDVRGRVIADYQEYLEKEWIRTLREKYPVTVDEKILKTVKKN
jgi:hypothetical protein